MADSAEVRRRSPVPSFGSNQSFQSVSPYSSEQDSSSLPAAQPNFHRFLEVGNPLYSPPTRLPGYFEQQQNYIDTIPTVDPHVLHQGTTHRHNSWDRSSIDHESNDDGHGAWTPTARDQNYRHQMAFGNDSQEYRGGYRYSTVSIMIFHLIHAITTVLTPLRVHQTPQSEHIQADPFSPAPNRRRSSFQDEFREEVLERR